MPVPSSRSKTSTTDEAARILPETAGVPTIQATPNKLAEATSDARVAVNAKPMPDWAIERAKALLQTGISVPEIEKRLVAEGLSPTAATAIVEKVLEDRVRLQVGRLEQTERHSHVHRVLSALVGALCVLVSFWFFDTRSASMSTISVLLPLACVWFPDEMGAYVSKYSLTATSPGVFVRWCGWLVLALLTIRALWIVFVVWA